MPEPSESAGSAAPRGRPADRAGASTGLRATTFLGLLFAIGGLAFVVHRISATWAETRSSVTEADLATLAASFVVALAGMTAIALPWPDVVRALGGRLGRADAVALYFVGEIGKYLPGGVWPVVGRSELARQRGVGRVAAYTGVLLSLAALYLAALLLAAALLPIVLLRGGTSSMPAALLVLLVPVALACLHPAVLGRLLRWVERVTGRSIDIPLPQWRTLVGLVARYFPAWLLIGTATWLVTDALDADVGWLEICLATVLGWSAGFLVAPAPGGVGVREAVFVAATASTAGDVGAVAALVARLVFMSVDGSAAAVCGVLIGSRRRRPPPVEGVSSIVDD